MVETPLLSRRLLRFITCGAALLAACGGEGTGPTIVKPAALTAVGDTVLDLMVAAAVPTAPSVRVVDASGTPLGDVDVTFATEGGGTATGLATKTNPSGIAAVGSWTVGTSAGDYKLIASVSGLAPIVFRARARAGAASKLVVVSGDKQSDTVSALLAQPLVVRAEDVHGNPVAGVEVTFSPQPVSGTLSPATATTDATGSASTRWSLGALGGPAGARAAIGTTITATFTATTEWPPIRAVWIASGFFHSCAVLTHGPTYCWGDNSEGQLGDGTTTNRNIAVRTFTIVTFKSVTAGTYHTCGLTADGQAYCWGRNVWGQIGDGTKVSRPNPTAVATSVRFTSLDAGGDATCGLSVDGEVYCWGFMENASTAETPQLVSGAIRFSAIAKSDFQLCGISTGGVTYCFDGAFSSGAGKYVWQPKALSPSPAFTALDGGLRFMCGLTPAGAVYCWGWNQYGQRGDGTSDENVNAAPLVPTQPVTGNRVFKSIGAGYTWACGTTVANETYCWGQNSWGAFGIEGPQVNPTPVLMPNPSGLAFTASSRGFYHSCAIATTSLTYCWGGGFEGQLSDGVDRSIAEAHFRPAPSVARHR